MESNSCNRNLGSDVFAFSAYFLALTAPLSMVGAQIGAGLVMLSGLWLAFSRRRRSNLPLWVTVFLGAFLILVIISAALSEDPGAAIPQLRKSWVFLCFFPLVMFRSLYCRRTMMLVLLWATVAASSIGAWRYIAGAVDRAAPFSGGYTTLALFDASAIPIAVAFIADSRAGHRWFNVAALVTMLAGLVMTETRAGWLAALAGVVVIGLAISKRVTAGVVLAALAIALAVPQSRLSIFNRSEIEKKGGISSGRLELWSAAREPLTHLPFFGYGPGSFLRLIPKEALEATGDPGIQSWHATALDILIESGPMALLLIMGLAIVTLWESWRSYFRAVNGRLRSLALFSTLVALYLASLTTNLARDFMLSSLLVIVWSLSFADDSQAEAAGNKSLSSVSLA